MGELKEKAISIIIGCMYGLFGLVLIGISNYLLAGNEYKIFIVLILFIVGSVFIIAAFVRMRITRSNRISEFNCIKLILKISIAIISIVIAITIILSVIIRLL